MSLGISCVGFVCRWLGSSELDEIIVLEFGFVLLFPHAVGLWPKRLGVSFPLRPSLGATVTLYGELSMEYGVRGAEYEGTFSSIGSYGPAMRL